MREFNERLEQIKKKLLDLTKRNKLINYRRPSKARNLRIIDESPEFIYKYLVGDEKLFKFKPIPYPTMMPKYLALLKKQKLLEKKSIPTIELEEKKLFSGLSWSEASLSSVHTFSTDFLENIYDYKNKKKSLLQELDSLLLEIDTIANSENFTVEKQAKELGLKISYQMPEIELHDENNFDIHLDGNLQTLHYADELEKILKHTELKSRSIMDVTGSNMLYLVLGVLEWKEHNKPDVFIKSPLVTVPVALRRVGLNTKTNTYDYTLSFTGEVIDTNESLRQKLFYDFKIELPTFSEEVSFNTYIKEVQKICVGQNDWKIKQEIALDFLQFGKVLMYKDLQATNLHTHTILRDIFLGTSSSTVMYAVNEYNIDKEPTAKNMPLVLDADSSQHSAMVDVLKGKNVVIEGPPGTGKSQIIANLIAVLMNEGKKVLFVSEKLVALEVVYQRLEQVGLGDFCLELHSHKTDKVEFLQNLNRRIMGEYGFAYNATENKNQLERTKNELNRYLDTLHLKYGKNNKTIFENIWLRERYLEGKEYFRFKITNALNLKSDNLLHCEEYLKEYQLHYAEYQLLDFFWRDFDVSSLSFMQIDTFLGRAYQLEEPYRELSNQFKLLNIQGIDEPLALEKLKKFVETFTHETPYYFPFSDLKTFQTLEDKLQAYLQTFVGYLDASEMENLLTVDILESVRTSWNILTELSTIESALKPELIAFQLFLNRAQKSFDKFEEIEQRNSENLYLQMVNHKSSEEIYRVVSTVLSKKESWFRFFSPSYKKAKRVFESLLRERLPGNSDEWTFLLRELNVYTLNRENQLTLRLSLVKQVPLFIQKITEVSRNIKESLDAYESIVKSDLDEPFKALMFEGIENIKKFDPLLKQAVEVEYIVKALEPYGTFNRAFYSTKKKLTFELMLKKLEKLEEHKITLGQWISFQNLLNKLKNLGLKEMMKSVERNEIPKEKLIDTFYYNYYNSLVESAFLKYTLLEAFSRTQQETFIKRFRKLDVQVIKDNRTLIAHKLSKNKLPPSEGSGRVATFTNLKLLKHEIGKKRRHVPIRQLLKRAGETIGSLKPCFMMSPLSVAQYLPINESSFDVLLIDEASQLKPEEALGVIARAKQVVVVGDPKQLPPTSFFDTIQEESVVEEKTVLDDSESILDSFMELYTPVRRLKWHYRSQHESLISFSNKHFYDEELTIFPSPSSTIDESLGVKYTYVKDGIYKSGSQHRTNLVEAQKVLETIEYQMQYFPEKSLGVGTLNGTQQALIQELVDELEKKNSYVSSYIAKWTENHEAFFVKNLESLQGDERDVILISTTYGKEEGSERLNQRFGPINQENGWRRLNVLISRSKQKMHIFTSMLSWEIRASDSSSRGIKALREFLNFLEMGQASKNIETKKNASLTFNSVFAEILYTLLKSKGVEVVSHVGVSGYYIELAIVSKKDGRYILALECDGENYYNSKSSSDRDRLKSEALRRLGWNQYHIWSAQWYKNREMELERLFRRIEEAEEALFI